MGAEILQSLLQHANASGSKSTALQPLVWVITVLTTALVAAVQVQASPWIVGGLAVLAGVVVLALLAAYWHFAVKNPDYLRSERFNLTKMQIEKNQLGDTSVGFKDSYAKLPALPALEGEAE